MSIKITRTWTRPSTEVPFFTPKENLKMYIDSTYMNSGKIIEILRSYTQTSATMATTFVNEAALAEFENDPVIMSISVARNDYNAAVGHIEEVIMEEI